MDDFALTVAERTLFAALTARGVRFIVVGLGAAVLEGAPVATQDIDLWFEESTDDRIRDAAKAAGGFWISGFGMQPPAFGGEGLDRIDVVLTVHGLGSFKSEYAATVPIGLDGVTFRILSLERIIASKRATNRAKDQAALPALEATLLAKKVAPAPLLHVTTKSNWESIQKGGLLPRRKQVRDGRVVTGGDPDRVSAFGGVACDDREAIEELRQAVADSKNSNPWQGEQLTAEDMVVLRIDKRAGDEWQEYPGESGELRSSVSGALTERITYWKTDRAIPADQISLLPSE